MASKVIADGAGYVITAKRIDQSPLDDAPAVPAGTRGHIEDEADGFLWVDFGAPYGVVCVDGGELEAS